MQSESPRRSPKLLLVLLLAMLVLAGCSREDLPIDLPREVPALPSLDEMPDFMRDLGLPNLDNLPIGVPEIADLPVLNAGPNTLVLAGPTERRIGIGERIPGTDIELVDIGEEGAEFHIAGLRSMRVLGDSLDFDGSWTGANSIDYTLRLRIYNIGDRAVRAAGVQRLVVHDVQPTQQEVSLDGTTLTLPYTGDAAPGQTFKGLTYGYAGVADRGAELTGLPEGNFPYRNVGDSIRWEGLLRPDLPVEYNLRVLFYNDDTLQVGGVATVQLPGQ